MRAIAARFAKDEAGATAIEYALMAGIIALGIVASVSALPTGLNAIFNNMKTSISP
jgi:pilus assembly protein Flp/PilA